MSKVDELVQIYGEHYRKLISDALTWLEQVEPAWELDQPIDKNQFIASLIEDRK
jgi:hypothetical protein